MFSFRKLTTPAPSRKHSITSMRTRCFSAKLTMPFMMTNPRGSVALGGAIDEEAAAVDHRLARLEPGEHFHRAADDLADADFPQRQRLVGLRHPHPRLLAVVDDG